MIKTPLEPKSRRWTLALAGSLALALVAVTFTTARGQDPPAPAEPEQGAPTIQGIVPVATDPAAPLEVLPVLAEVTPVLAEVTTENASAIDIAVEPQVDPRSVQLEALRKNEVRLAELDHEIASMTAANKHQEVEILTSLRGELLKEIYRAKYLPPASETAPGTSMKPMKKAASALQKVEKNKPATAEPKPATGAGMSMNDYLARYPKGAAAEVGALRAQMAAIAAQLDELKRQLVQSSFSQDATPPNEKEPRKLKSSLYRPSKEFAGNPTYLDHPDAKTAALQAALLADQARFQKLEQRYSSEHPTLKAMKAKLEADKRELDEAARSHRNQIKAKPKPEKDLPDLKPLEDPPSEEQAQPDPKPQPAKPKPEAPRELPQASREGATNELPGPRKASPPAEKPVEAAPPVSVPAPEPKPIDSEAKPSADSALPSVAPAVIAEPGKKRFIILGAVNKPGAYNLPESEPFTLLQAIGRAGGYLRIASRSKISVKRAGGDVVIVLNGKKTANEKESTPFLVQPGDVITVLEGWG